MTAAGTAVVHGPRLQDYNPSDDATRPLRRELGIELIDAYGLRDAPGAIRVDPPSASQEDVERIHAPAYVRAVRRLSDAPVLAAAPEAAHWGLSPGGDTPARAGMHEAALAVCGASLTAASLVWEERALRAFCPAPAGLHHARAAQASGFCVYNDCALAIRRLLDAGAERVAYVDIDAHHGDGVQWLFYEEPRVLTCSVHESGRFLYPGTGGLAERGAGEAVGTAVNVPLPPFAGDAPYLRAIDEVIAPAVRRFRPDVLITHQGADPHHEDPYSHLQVSLDGLRASYRMMNALAADAAGGRWIVLAGGGYNIDLLARAWTLQLAEMLAAEPEDAIPADWLALARDRAGRRFTERLRADPAPDADPARRLAADAEASAVIDQARALLG
ncbi:MAG TPA: acetoin utilization protein AcuC [Miltoncostaeaceae bacterium]|nr:acetoin utilization protein AcuC [Miltoncostaeaceae bacterium]